MGGDSVSGGRARLCGLSPKLINVVIPSELIRSEWEHSVSARDREREAAGRFLVVGKARGLGRAMALSNERRQRM